MCREEQMCKRGSLERTGLFKAAIGKNEGMGAEVGGPRL